MLAKQILRPQQSYGILKASTKRYTTGLENSDGNSSLEQEWQAAKPFKELPGPSKFELFRGFLKGGEFHGKPFDAVMRVCRQRYGDIYLLPGMFGLPTNLVSFNLADHEKVFRTEDSYPARPGLEAVTYYRLSQKNSMYSEEYLGVAGSGENWGKFRHMVNPVLMQPKNTRLYIEPLQNINAEFIERIRYLRDPQTLEVPSNFIYDINRLSLESVAHIALDKRMGLLENQPLSSEAKSLFDNLFTFGDAIYELGIQPSIYRYIKTPAYKRFESAMDTVYEICHKYVLETMERLERQPNTGEEKSILEKLLKLDRKMAIITAIDLLMGGVEITSTVMSAIFLCLAKNPEKQEKLRQEILTNIGKNADFSLDNMKHLPYLRACIKEALRIYPVLFGNIRITGRNLNLSGYQIPKDTNVFMASNMLLHEAKYFPKPLEFIPERWLRSTETGMQEYSAKHINPFIFLPFGFGPRSCLGKRIVDMELEITVANIVRNFHMEYNYSTENAFRTYFMNTCILPLKFKFTDL
ncbi:probable cytochrome P450 12c1, mitochondrial [Musca vetustissima]|uniref:probable cytochrome P450 12c1, mitochondrial n=1 Tax=Musca vetustissima TaxID=27455 RepID=UPI002AB72656|nr:probable cytochrome P450 12c1, mitochondrial [Musca vetustissima]